MRTIQKVLLSTTLIVSSAIAAAITFTPSTASAQEYYVSVVPPAYIAWTEPVYYGGRAHYYYNGSWMYRDGARWRYYRQEPAYFHDWRTRYPSGRWYYHR